MHVHLFPAFYAAAFAQVRTKLVYTEHSTHNRRRSMKMARPIERAAYRRYDQLIGISDGVTDGLRSYLQSMGLPPDVRTIPNGIGNEYFEDVSGVRTRPSKPIKLIAIGTLDDRKNFALAVNALAEVRDAELTIVGGGPFESQLRDQIEQKGLTGRVRLLGRRSDVRALLDAHDALLSTSRFEGFGLVAAEAMARGLPVIGPNVDGFRDVVVDGESGVLYDPKEPTGRTVAAAVGRIADATFYESLSQGALLRSASFTIRQAAAAHLSVYSRVGA
jgi:glycosyltransferase involved in cell wall biosynthesis